MSPNNSRGLPRNKYLPGLGTWEFDTVNVENDITSNYGLFWGRENVDLTSQSFVDLIRWGDVNFIATIAYDVDNGGTFDFNAPVQAPAIIPTNLTPGRVVFSQAYSSYPYLVDAANFTYDGNKLTLGGATSSTNGLRLGADVDLFRGAANRLDLATGDSFYIPNNVNGLGVGTTPNTSFTTSILRTTTGAVAANDYALHAQMSVVHGNAANFPGAFRARADVSAGANTVSYHSAFQALAQATNLQSGAVSNLYGCDLSARWNTQQATATCNILIGGSFTTTADATTSQGTLSTIYGGQFVTGLPTGSTLLTITGNIFGGRFVVNIPQAGCGGATAFGIALPNHSIGASAPINRAGHILLTPLTAAYGSGTKYPILFDGTNTSANEVGIWWGTDANNVNLYRGGNNQLKTDDKLQVSPLTNTATSGSFVGVLAQVNSAPASSSTSRNWGLQFAVAATNAQNHTDGSGGIIGFEGYARNESTGTVTREIGGLVYCDNTAAGTVSTSIVYHGFNSTSHASAVTSDATVFRASAGTATGTTTAWYGFRADAPAFTANGQTRVNLRIGAMPSIGAFTGTTNIAINIEGTSRLAQDGIRIGGDTNLYSSAANTLKTDDLFRAELGVSVPGTSGATFIATSNTTAPSTTGGGAPADFYGNAATPKVYMGNPLDWLLVNVNGTDRKIPLY